MKKIRLIVMSTENGTDETVIFTHDLEGDSSEYTAPGETVKSLNCRKDFNMKKHECEPYKGHLPKRIEKYRSKITDFFHDSDGAWAYFVPGWKRENSNWVIALRFSRAYFAPGWIREPNDDVHFAHVDPDDGQNFSDLIKEIKNAVKCDCDDCMEYINNFKDLK